MVYELCRLFLSCDNPTGSSEFSEYRVNALVGLLSNAGTACSRKAARFLCREFYARNYAISQRLLILQVCSTAKIGLVEG